MTSANPCGCSGRRRLKKNQKGIGICSESWITVTRRLPFKQLQQAKYKTITMPLKMWWIIAFSLPLLLIGLKGLWAQIKRNPYWANQVEGGKNNFTPLSTDATTPISAAEKVQFCFKQTKRSCFYCCIGIPHLCRAELSHNDVIGGISHSESTVSQAKTEEEVNSCVFPLVSHNRIIAT